ncbi:MAG: DUF4347 domain-containing protein, partial [Ottowia sp.]
MSNTNTQNILFIDSAVGDISSLLASVDPSFEVVLLSADRSGLEQIAQALAGRTGVDAVHVISHGGPGYLQLGDATLDLEGLNTHSESLATIRAALSDNADLLLYGCDVAAGEAGAAFISALANATGADVAASVDATGPALLGGDSHLEASTGTIEAQAIDASALSELLAAPSIGGLDPVSFTENGSAVVVDGNMSASGGSNYGGGYIQFSLNGSNVNDFFSLTSAGSVNASGAVSVSGSTVFLGNGSGRDAIGSIDGSLNGQNGNALRINFTSAFQNPSFETGTTAFWTIGQSRVILGQTNIAGWTSPSDPTNPGRYGGQDGTMSSQAYYYSVTSGGSADGTYSLRLYNSAIGPSYHVLHGPYAYSNAFNASSGDTLFFDWKAAGGEDAYDAFGYLLNTATGQATIVLNQTGSSASASTNWATASVSVPTSGEYRFVFVSGTWDATGGKWSGGSLYIDNVKVFGNRVNDSVATSILRQVTYQNNAADAPTSRAINITTADGQGNTRTTSTTLNITHTNDAPSFNGNATLASVSEDASGPGATVSALYGARFVDPDNAYSPTDSLAGIVVVGNAATAGQGAWQYSTDGGSSWYDVGAVSTGSGLTLQATAHLRFLPAPDWNGTPGALSVRAVDSSGGVGSWTSGATAVYYSGSYGGSSAVAASSVSLSTSVLAVNDAPVFGTGAVVLTFTDTVETDAFSPLTGSILASDAQGGAPGEGGTVTYSLLGGTTSGGFSNLVGPYGTLSLNTSTGAYTFLPNADAINALAAGVNPTLTYAVRAADGQGGFTDQAFTINITGGNDRPVLTGDNPDQPTSYANLPTIAEDTVVVGQTVANLFAPRVTDVDNGASFGGVIIAGNAADADTQGVWQYKVVGGSWANVPTDVSATEGLALSATTSLRFLPALNYNGAPGKLTVHATDNDFVGYTTASTPVLADVTADGVSVISKALGITITPVNDAPTFRGPAPAATLNDTAAWDAALVPAPGIGALSGTLKATDVEPAQELAFSIRGGAFNVVDADTVWSLQGLYGLLTVNEATGAWDYTPNRFDLINALPALSSVEDVFLLKVTDPDGGIGAQPLTITIQGTNDLPVLDEDGIDDQSFQGSGQWSYQIPADTFTDAEGLGLTYTATLGNNDPLPSWLSFDAPTRIFSGNPPANATDIGRKVTATDESSASVSGTFALD